MTKITLETLSKDIAYIRESINEIKVGVVPRPEVDLRLLELQNDVQSVRTNLTRIEKHVNKRFRWEVIGSNIMTAFLVSLLTILVTFFVQNSGA